MKFNQFKKIVERIQKEIPCPRCKNLFISDAIDIVNLKDNDIHLVAECPNCIEKVSISASLERSLIRPVSKVSRKRDRIVNKVLSPEEIAKISEKMKSFRGGDVRDLFEEKFGEK